MAEEQIVNCIKNCWYSAKAIYFVRGDEASIDPLDPVAMYFDGWAPGTEVYHKTRGNAKQGTDPVETTRIVPGKVEEPVEEPEEVTVQTAAELEAEATNRLPCPWADCDNDYQDEGRLKAHLTKAHGGERPPE